MFEIVWKKHLSFSFSKKGTTVDTIKWNYKNDLVTLFAISLIA